MNCKKIIIVSFVSGILFFLIQRNIIILRNPFFVGESFEEADAISNKKNIVLYVWYNDALRYECREILWPRLVADRLVLLIKTWLDFADEECQMSRHVSLQAVALSPTNQDIYLSFDRNPFDGQASTFEKILWIESVLKTIRENESSVYNVYFLVDHQPLEDAHIDFLHPWPIQGFIKSD